MTDFANPPATYQPDQLDGLGFISTGTFRVFRNVLFCTGRILELLDTPINPRCYAAELEQATHHIEALVVGFTVGLDLAVKASTVGLTPAEAGYFPGPLDTPTTTPVPAEPPAVDPDQHAAELAAANAEPAPAPAAEPGTPDQLDAIIAAAEPEPETSPAVADISPHPSENVAAAMATAAALIEAETVASIETRPAPILPEPEPEPEPEPDGTPAELPAQTPAADAWN